MASKISFVIVILALAFVVVMLAALGWMQGYAWWQRKERFF